MLSNPLLLLCIAIGFGALLGRISIKNVSLGVAGVLFAGIMCGYVEPSVKPPEALATFGLSLFVYAIGLSSSDFLFDTWTHGGWRYLLIPPIALGAAFGVNAFAVIFLNVQPSAAAGVFAGALTNTPALAAATTALGQRGAEATLGYAIAYPLGVLIPIIMLAWPFRRETPHHGDTLTSGAILVRNISE
ncbi:MAG: transporter, partial [Deltaproteobacteria bacterium]